MGELVDVTLEIDSELKNQVEKIFMEYGLSLEEATILFFKETVRLGKLPFEVDEDLKNYIAEQNTSSGNSVRSVIV
jgi:addiction module RelB/DinJ family antitoxin